MFAIDDLGQAKHANIKLTFWSIEPMLTPYKQRILYIPLDDPRLSCLPLLQELLQHLNIFEDLDAHPSLFFLRFPVGRALFEERGQPFLPLL